MTVHVLVEGELDRLLLERLLSDLHGKARFKVQATRGRDAGRPLARKCLMIHGEPAAFVMDSDTRDERRVQQQQQDLESYLAWGGHGVAFKVLQFVPEIEVIFFDDQRFLERVLGRALQESVGIAGHAAPREMLQSLCSSVGIDRRALIPTRLEAEDLARFRRHAAVSELRDFIAAFGVDNVAR